MNASIHRVGLAIAAVTVVVTVGGLFVVDGYFSARRTASTAPVGSITDTAVSPAASAGRTVPPEVVYVRPAPSPKVIHITRTAPPAPAQIVHVSVPGAGGEGNERERGGETDGGGD
ncbi:MAG: hypothetical protein ACLQBX_17405 [Candidatus Limnocylindrales bacterium]